MDEIKEDDTPEEIIEHLETDREESPGEQYTTPAQSPNYESCPTPRLLIGRPEVKTRVTFLGIRFRSATFPDKAMTVQLSTDFLAQLPDDLVRTHATILMAEQDGIQRPVLILGRNFRPKRMATLKPHRNGSHSFKITTNEDLRNAILADHRKRVIPTAEFEGLS
jgi:hypothetical protein